MLWSAFILGAMGSWHCVGMCGPIALMVPGSKGKNKLIAAGLYNLGKVSAYVLIGLLFGLFTAFIDSFKVQAIITISVGVVIGLLALIPSILNYAEKKGFKLFSTLINFKNKLSQVVAKHRLDYGLYIGFFNGFIPCGMVYIAALGAMIQPSLLESVLYMVFFGIGTMPALSAVILASGFIKSKLKFNPAKVRLVAFLLLSAFMMYKGISQLNTKIEQPKEGDHFQICEQASI
ncbi:sulfite exporter TauE/SafE family protein [Paracrocinitomix mangrovi]|uniref:sulfite exporter TauE/SafE family protein n=1 Tax=Paracrocinitomix mangrovi TaxID=2862509 RepID=UPI001C8D9534|nr:sulfite exporter TauE/SafE family protein [Paracrocinitomix mangrovi]UKN01486.1 sulfite exporter TauE/SafE family protein [Paracrocinitomix mangrovi]